MTPAATIAARIFMPISPSRLGHPSGSILGEHAPPLKAPLAAPRVAPAAGVSLPVEC
jgi:hypothetical protein